MFLPYELTYAQADLKVQNVAIDLVQEGGSPVGIDSAEAELEFDPFNTPVALRAYVNYKNISPNAIVGVKFRLQLLDNQGETRGIFLANDTGTVETGGTGSQKWRKEGINPATKRLLARVLQVKFADGTTWSSDKLHEFSGDTAGGSPVTPPPAAADSAQTAIPGTLEPSGEEPALRHPINDKFEN
jgi:hypothetical protein